MMFTAAVKFGTSVPVNGAGIAQRYDGNQELCFVLGQWQLR
jgi:hypothetical protein